MYIINCYGKLYSTYTVPESILLYRHRVRYRLFKSLFSQSKVLTNSILHIQSHLTHVPDDFLPIQISAGESPLHPRAECDRRFSLWLPKPGKLNGLPTANAPVPGIVMELHHQSGQLLRLLHHADATHPGRKEVVFREVQLGGSAPWRLPKPHERLRHRKAERLDECKRHP